ncbi:MAG: divalent-cation tolerance protein CutA [Rickettsiales bacterium]|jgi:periplasmic divalent cation tolerance protein|nr:divalent-cation tolerance protein CutA [Rickettsiales bacterium]
MSDNFISMPDNLFTKYFMAYTTAANQKEADKITRALLESRLAACVQQTPINSQYWWKGKIEKSSEILLAIKTMWRPFRFTKIKKLIKENHSYEVPQIIAIPIIAGSKDYLGWIKEETK